jgi:hypothetical protein
MGSGKLGSILAGAARSPWAWPIVPLTAVAAVGQWRGTAAAEVAAALLGLVGVGIAIGLGLAGGSTGRTSRPGNQSETAQSGIRPHSGVPAERHGGTPQSNSLRTADLRGARLANTTLAGADLRQADLRGAVLTGANLNGAVLTGADLSGADLTDARLGPLDDKVQSNHAAQRFVSERDYAADRLRAPHILCGVGN